MTEAYQQIIEVLERRFYGQPVPVSQLLSHALGSAAFSQYWLSHAIAADASNRELAVVLTLAAVHQFPALGLLQQYWGSDVPSQSLYSQFMAQLQPFTGLLPLTQMQLAWQEVASFENTPPEHPLRLAALWAQICQCQNPVVSTNPAEPLQLHQLSTAEKWLTLLPEALDGQFQRAGVYGINSSAEQHQDVRDCGQFICPLPQHEVIFASFERQVAQATGQQLAFAEPLVILRYLPGEQFKWHCDFISSTHQQALAELAMFGQRVHTSICYLNDNFLGGETEFKFWQRQIKPQRGMVVSFANVNALGQVDKNSTHRGCPVLEGTKFVATSWYRNNKLWHRAGLFSATFENETKR